MSDQSEREKDIQLWINHGHSREYAEEHFACEDEWESYPKGERKYPDEDVLMACRKHAGKPVTPEGIRARVEAISPSAAKGHSEEDGIWIDTLRAIAEGHAKPCQLAAAALESLRSERERWYA